MGFINWIKGVINKMFATEAEKAFGIDIEDGTVMDYKIAEWFKTYQGQPQWVDASQRIKTINMANAICEETARLTNLALEIQIDGGERAEWLKQVVDKAIMPRLRGWIEYACAAGTVILKPCGGDEVDIFLPDSFRVVASSNGMINDIVFQDQYSTGKDNNKTYYTKLERHSYMHADVSYKTGESKEVIFYHVENKAFKSNTEHHTGKEIPLADTKWAALQPDVYITKENDSKLNTMLFGVLKMPAANDIDIDSPLGTAVFSGAMEELKDLDIAYSRNVGEIYDSESIELLDDRLINMSGQKIGSKSDIKLPHHVHNVYGADSHEFYQAIERPLNTDKRIVGINNLLSMIGYKCGYSNGYFVLDQKTGMVTATQVESDDRRTIQLIKDIRDNLQVAVNDTIYALSVFADLYDLAPVGEYETNYSFGDITYNYEEDKQHHYDLAKQGKYPWEEYYVQYLKYSRKEARELLKKAQEENKQNGLFDEE